MAKITCVESTMALSQLTGAVSPTMRTADQLTFVVRSGTTAVTLPGIPGLPGFIAPAVVGAGQRQVPPHGLARVGTWLGGPAHLALITFDASVALDLERVYLAVAGIFYGDTFTW